MNDLETVENAHWHTKMNNFVLNPSKANDVDDPTKPNIDPVFEMLLDMESSQAWLRYEIFHQKWRMTLSWKRSGIAKFIS